MIVTGSGRPTHSEDLPNDNTKENMHGHFS